MTFIRMASNSPRKSSTRSALPPDLLEKSRRRVRVVGFLILFGAGIDLLFMSLALFVGGARPDEAMNVGSLLPFIGNIVTVSSSIFLIAMAGSRRLSNPRLLDVALVYEVLLAMIISASNPSAFYQDSGALPLMTWVTPLIIFFPLIVPAPPRRTLVVSLVAASTRPLGLLILSRAGMIEAAGEAYFAAVFSPALAVAIAYFGSKVVYGLGIEVAEARRMGSYRLEEMLGKGGMGEVWRASHGMLARPAAVKLVRPDFAGATPDRRDSVVQRFQREAQATAALRSPHTISLYDFGIADDGTFYYVMELLDGFDAERLIGRFGSIPTGRAIHLLRQLCHSLAEAHETDFIHRDIKPANVFVCRYGRDVDFVKILDFGLVASVGREERSDLKLTAENTITGTPAYMAPEQAMGTDGADLRSDIYSTGCLAYWLLTGQLVFEGGSALEILTHHARTAPRPPSERAELPLPGSVDRLVLDCLEKDPAGRPQSVAELAKRLDECAGDAPWTEEKSRRWWDLNSPQEISPNLKEIRSHVTSRRES